jgi:hypothetical protein
VRRFASSFSLLRHQSTRHFVRLVFCSCLLSFATAAFAAPTVTVLSPNTSSDSGSPVFYEAYATSPSCANGINAMRIYSAPYVNAYTVNGAHIETFIPLAAGTYSTVVQAWDNCGGVGKTTVNITVNSNAGLSVFLPSSGSAGIPVHVAASVQNPECSGGISAMRIYTANGTTPYTIDSNQLNTFVNLLPGTYGLTVQAWDNCGHVYKSQLTETATPAASRYLYVANEGGFIVEFGISGGVLTNSNGSGNIPPGVSVPSALTSLAIDPGGWFAYAVGQYGIYGVQIDQSSGAPRSMPGSPFALNGKFPTDVAIDPNGNFLFVAYYDSNTIGVYSIDRSTGAITETATATQFGGTVTVTADFTGQYLYAINQNDNSSEIWGYKINLNSGTLTAVPGSPYTIANANYGVALSSTMLPSGSPASPLLYAQTDGPGFPLMGYSVNYGTGALTVVPGAPFDFDETTHWPQSMLADSQGKWVWSAALVGANPPQDWFNYASIGSNGTLSPTSHSTVLSEYLSNYAVAEDGSGQYLYATGNYCPSSGCSPNAGTAATSWKLNDGDPVLLSGPFITGANGDSAIAVGVVPRTGD